MSYLAIARKYRPATFAEMVGQDHVTRTLGNAIRTGRVHHAYLFAGARGVGKTTAARALARALNCASGPTVDPCGICPSCRDVANGSSPDLIEIDGASNNSVDDVRELRETVRYAATNGRYRVFLVDEVHMLSKGAFNALLKTLEEPPPNVVFLFATTEVSKIPETILSRVQRFDFRRIGVPALFDRLRTIAEQEGVTVTDTALRRIARAGDGSMRDAQSLLDQVIATAGAVVDDKAVADALGLVDRAWVHAMVEGLCQGRPDQCLGAIDTVHGYGFEIPEFAAEVLDAIRDAAFLRIGPGTAKYLDLPEEEMVRLREITEGVAPESLSRLFDALVDVYDTIAKAARPRIVLEMAVARLATLRPVEPAHALVARLDAVERSLRHGGAPPPPMGLRRDPAPRAEPQPHRPEPPKPPALEAPKAPEPEATPVPRQAAPVAAPEAVQRPADPPPSDPGPTEPSLFQRPAPADPMEAFRAFLRTGSDTARRLADGPIEVLGHELVFSVDTKRKVSEGRRVATHERVVNEARRLFAGVTAVRVEEQAAGPDATRQVLSDPQLQRIVRGLDATVERVVSPREED